MNFWAFEPRPDKSLYKTTIVLCQKEKRQEVIINIAPCFHTCFMHCAGHLYTTCRNSAMKQLGECILNEAVGDLLMTKLFAYVTNYMNNSLARMTEET